MSRRAASFALRLTLDRDASRLASAVSGAIVHALADGQLADGDLVPSSRAMAANLGVARSVVVDAYAELSAAGFLTSQAGAGTWVERGAVGAARAGALASPRGGSVSAADPPRVGPAVVEHDIPDFDLRPGRAEPAFIDAGEWTRAWRDAARTRMAGSGTGARAGVAAPDPSEAVADYLRQTRGLVVSPHELCFFPSVSSALSVLSGALAKRQGALAFENPGYDIGRQAFASGGAEVRPVAVDDEGIDVSRLRPTDWGVYVTPAHQFPTGCRMSVSRRSALLEWAGRTGAIVFEDDYDAEFRYDVPPMPPLKSMSRLGSDDRVVYVGTSSKILTQDLRVAWAVVPTRWRAAVDSSQVQRGAYVSPVALAALAALIRSRALTRQLLRAHRVYAARRDRLTSALRAQLPSMRLLGIDAGLHVLVELPAGYDDAGLVRTLAGHGLLCSPLSRYVQPGTRSSARGLVCGYANLPETRAAEAVSLLRRTMAELAGGSAR